MESEGGVLRRRHVVHFHGQAMSTIMEVSLVLFEEKEGRNEHEERENEPSPRAIASRWVGIALNERVSAEGRTQGMSVTGNDDCGLG